MNNNQTWIYWMKLRSIRYIEAPLIKHCRFGKLVFDFRINWGWKFDFSPLQSSLKFKNTAWLYLIHFIRSTISETMGTLNQATWTKSANMIFKSLSLYNIGATFVCTFYIFKITYVLVNLERHVTSINDWNDKTILWT